MLATRGGGSSANNKLDQVVNLLETIMDKMSSCECKKNEKTNVTDMALLKSRIKRFEEKLNEKADIKLLGEVENRVKIDS
jgi:hypothetical protein